MKLTVIVSLVFLMAMSALAGTLRDDFSDGDIEGWEVIPLASQADWSVKDGKLIGIRNDLTSDLVIGELDWSNYSIEAKIKLIQRLSPPNSAGAGFVVYQRDWGNTYTFFLYFMVLLVRYRADPKIVELNSALTGGYNIHLSSNPGKGGGTGGLCFGDSGGPAFLDEGSNIVGGVGSFVLNQQCVGAGFYYRVDTQHALDFINAVMPAPSLGPVARLATQWAKLKTHR